MLSDFVKGRNKDEIAWHSLADISTALLYHGEYEEVSGAKALFINSPVLLTMFQSDSGSGLRFLTWANILSRAVEVFHPNDIDFGHHDTLPAKITALLVIETRVLNALICLQNQKRLTLSRYGSDISCFKLLTDSGVDPRMVALSAPVSPSAVNAFLNGPCGSYLWRAISGTKKELHAVCEEFYRLTGFSKNDIYCIGGAAPDFWRSLLNYLPELFFSFYAVLISNYRLGEKNGIKRYASDMLIFQEGKIHESLDLGCTNRKEMPSSRLDMISNAKELNIIYEATDIILAEAICHQQFGFSLCSLFGAYRFEEKIISDYIVNNETEKLRDLREKWEKTKQGMKQPNKFVGFCSNGMIDAAVNYNFWSDFVQSPACKHELTYEDGTLLVSCGKRSLGGSAVAAWSRGESFESIGLSRVYGADLA